MTGKVYPYKYVYNNIFYRSSRPLRSVSTITCVWNKLFSCGGGDSVSELHSVHHQWIAQKKKS